MFKKLINFFTNFEIIKPEIGEEYRYLTDDPFKYSDYDIIITDKKENYVQFKYVNGTMLHSMSFEELYRKYKLKTVC